MLQAGFAVVRGPVHLIEIDGVDLQAAEAVFAFAANGFGSEFLPNVPLRVPAQNTFGENVRPWAAPFLQRARDDLFGVTQAVDGGSIDPIDAKFEGAMNGGDRIRIILRAPGELPAGTTEGPSAEADRRYFHVRVS